MADDFAETFIGQAKTLDMVKTLLASYGIKSKKFDECTVAIDFETSNMIDIANSINAKPSKTYFKMIEMQKALVKFSNKMGIVLTDEDTEIGLDMTEYTAKIARSVMVLPV